MSVTVTQKNCFLYQGNASARCSETCMAYSGKGQGTPQKCSILDLVQIITTAASSGLEEAHPVSAPPPGVNL